VVKGIIVEDGLLKIYYATLPGGDTEHEDGEKVKKETIDYSSFRVIQEKSQPCRDFNEIVQMLNTGNKPSSSVLPKDSTIQPLIKDSTLADSTPPPKKMKMNDSDKEGNQAQVLEINKK